MEIIIKKSELENYIGFANRMARAIDPDLSKDGEMTFEELKEAFKVNGERAIKIRPAFFDSVRITINPEYISEGMDIYSDFLCDMVGMVKRYMPRATAFMEKWL